MTNVQVPDAMLRRALEGSGIAPVGSAVDAAKLARVAHLDWSEDGIGEAEPARFGPVSDLRGLEHASGLRILGLGGSALRDLAPLKGHTTLEELWLNHNELTDVSAIDGMPRLRVANLDSNRSLVDIAPLAGATSLTYVNLSFTKVVDLTPLSGLERLTKLALFGLSFPRESASFTLLVRLVRRGCELLAERALLDEVRSDVERLRARDAEAKREALAKEKGTDPMLDALMAAGLDALAGQWRDGGARSRDALGRTLLHHLAAAPSIDDTTRATLTRALVEAGADLNAVQLCAPATSALGVFVSTSGSAEYVAALLELGADPDAGKSHPPLLVAVRSGDPARIDRLLAAGASVAPAFDAIVDSGSVDLVKRAIALAPNELRTEHLVRAVKRGSEDVVRALLDAGVDVNGAMAGEAPVLHHVETEALFDMLFAAGADLEAPNSLGATPLMAYLQRTSWRPEPSVALVQRAAQRGASASGMSKTEGHPIHILAGSSAPAAATLVPVLQELGADLHALTSGGRSAFDLARTPAMKAALKAAKVGTGKTMLGRLAKELVRLEAGDAAAWAAAKTLAGAHQPKLLAPFERFLGQRLRELPGRLASAFGSLEVTSEPVVVLLADGVDGVDARGTPLLHAISSMMEVDEPRRQDLVRALIAVGAKPDALDRMNTPALNVYLDFTNQWDVEVVAALATSAAVRPRIARSALAIALGRGASTGNAGRAVIDLLLERGSDLAVVVDAACFGGRLDVVRRAVETGARIPDSALHSAVYTNAVDVAAYLVQRGADPNRGATVHPLIVNASSVEMLDLLLEHGGDPFVLTANGETALHFAARVIAPRIVPLLERLEGLGIPRTIKDARGTTALALLQSRPEPEVQAYLSEAT